MRCRCSTGSPSCVIGPIPVPSICTRPERTTVLALRVHDCIARAMADMIIDAAHLPDARAQSRRNKGKQYSERKQNAGQVISCRTAICGAVAAAAVFVSWPSRRQGPHYGPLHAAGGFAASFGLDLSAASGLYRTTRPGALRLPLPRTARVLAAASRSRSWRSGSSSTYGAGASSSAAAYPNRLAEELVPAFPRP